MHTCLNCGKSDIDTYLCDVCRRKIIGADGWDLQEVALESLHSDKRKRKSKDVEVVVDESEYKIRWR